MTSSAFSKALILKLKRPLPHVTKRVDSLSGKKKKKIMNSNVLPILSILSLNYLCQERMSYHLLISCINSEFLVFNLSG